ncbi:MAG: hypothetical protein KAU48_08330 [Candidatus Thorarchaeota archaeon]|nr:hypothetical protein [Candidatus Thorarchaeota archaeon]
MDTTKSDRIVKDYREQKPKLLRRSYSFSGTFDTNPEELFPLLCPAREADWIPGWTTQLIYTESGYAEDKCVFKTDKSNAIGEGIWTFTGYELNKYIEFVRIGKDILMHVKIPLTENEDGTTTATWNVIATALNKNGNKKLVQMPQGDSRETPVVDLIGHYLKTGMMLQTKKSLHSRFHSRH